MTGIPIRIRNTRFWSLILVFWVCILIILNVIPNYTPPSLKLEEYSALRTDYVLHFLSFLILPVFYFLSGRKTLFDLILKTSWSLIIAGIFFAAFVEGIQIIVPGRSFNPLDMLFNVSGLLAGIPAGRFIIKLL